MSDVNSVMSPDAPQHRLGYDGRGGDIAKIALWNGILTLITFGIFRFWAKTRMRRYVWSRFSFDGDRVEYTGTGGELFKGFLVASLLFLLFAVPIQLATVFGEEATLKQVLNLIYAVVVMVLFGMAPYFAHRYRLTRTRWRGIRGGLQGKVKVYVALVIGYGLLTLVTLGVAFPIGSMARKRYLWNHSKFGTAEVQCTAKVGRAWLPWLLQYSVWVLFLGALAATLFLSGAWTEFQTLVDEDDQAALHNLGRDNALVLIGWLVAYVGVAILSAGCMVAFYLRELRQILNGLTVGHLRIASTLRARSMLWRIVAIAALQTLMVAILVAATIGLVVVQIIAGKGGFVGLFILFYLVVIVLSIILVAVLWTNPLYRTIAMTTTVMGSIDMTMVTQNTDAAPTRGEGLMELFSVDG